MTAFAGWVIRSRRTIIVVWSVVLLVASAGALQVERVLAGGSDGVPGSPSMQTIEHAIQDGFPAGTFFPFLILLDSDRVDVHDPLFEATAEHLARGLRVLPTGGDVRTFWNTGRADLLGRNRHTALILFRSGTPHLGEAELITGHIRSLIDRIHLPPGFRASVTGVAPTFFDLNRQSSADLLNAERIGVPITAAILLAAFGTPLAAGLPIIIAATSVAVSLAALFLLAQVTTVSVFSANVVSMIGLGLGVDYGLFVVKSFRSALAREESATHAASLAIVESGHAVVVSGAAVAASVCALVIVRVPFVRSIAAGGVLVVLVAGAAALTLLPVLLSYGGRFVDWPWAGRAMDRGGETWKWWGGLIMRRPWTFLSLGVGTMLIFVIPALHLHAWSVGISNIPPERDSRRGYDLLTSEFDRGAIGPTILLLRPGRDRTVWDRDFQRGVTALAERLGDDPRVARVNGFPDILSLVPSLHRTAVSSRDLPEGVRRSARDFIGAGDKSALLIIVPAAPPEAPESMALVRELRSDVFPELTPSGADAEVSGGTALIADFDDEIFRALPWVVFAVLTVTFVILVLAFQSVVIPLKAIVLNLLSVLASYGFLVYVFQDGFGTGILELQATGGLNSFIVLVLFTLLFGLSTDYEVFLLTHVRRAHVSGSGTSAAVSTALQQTGGTITSAALVMVSIFTVFGFTRLPPTRQLGLGLAFAVAIDATIVRLMLVPAAIVVMGRANWWLPSIWRRRSGNAVVTLESS